MRIDKACWVYLIIFISGCASHNLSSQPSGEWISNMHRLSNAHLKLMTVTGDSRKFSNPAHKSVVNSRAAELATATHEMLNDKQPPNADPLISYFSKQFAGEVQRATSAYAAGDLVWARESFQRTSTYCIACHTRLDRGGRNFALPWRLEFSNLSPAQKVEILLANRQYDSALSAAVALASDPNAAAEDPQPWLSALQKSLALTIRVNHNAEQSLQIIDNILKNPSTPSYMRRDALAWRRDILLIERDLKGHADKNHALADVVRLLRLQDKMGLRDRSTFILNLRASNLLHEIIERNDGQNKAALFYAGIVEELLHDITPGQLDLFYFENCIQQSPHTTLAENCFSRFEQLARKSNPYSALNPQSEINLNQRLRELDQLASTKAELTPRSNKVWREIKQDHKESRELDKKAK